MNVHGSSEPTGQLGVAGGAVWLCTSVVDEATGTGKLSRRYQFFNLGAGPQEATIQVYPDARGGVVYTGSLVGADGKLHLLRSEDAAVLLAALAALTGIAPVPLATTTEQEGTTAPIAE